jgi:hypothetical protein
VTITDDGHNTYKWSNEAGVEWKFEATEDENVFAVSSDNPYAVYGFDHSETTRDDRGQILTITGPFGEVYTRVGSEEIDKTYSVDFESTFYYSDIEAIRDLYVDMNGDASMEWKITALIPGSIDPAVETVFSIKLVDQT